MKFGIGVLVTFLTYTLCAQTPGEDISVQLSAIVQSGEITLNWENDGSATDYTIYRRDSPISLWGTSISTLAGSSNSYVDNTILDGVAHEYKIVKTGGTVAYGYVNAAFEKEAINNRGIIVVVVEDTYQGNAPFDAAVQMTLDDIENDGWIVRRIDVNQNDLVTSVKSDIMAVYNQDLNNTASVYLIGHVPVPYSGLMNPDGHPDHLGAWPADVYYGDVNGIWTDQAINDNTSAAQARNHNIPGDGKFDQGIAPGNVKLQVARVDFANMGAFSDSEETLLIRYMNKAHMYKTKQFTAQERALIDDNFATFPEGFSSSAYRNFSTMFTPANVDNTLDLRTATASNSYMWSYGCGAGSYTSCSGIGNTSNLAGDSLQTIFTMMFGSYFGDWDSDNNFLRAIITQGQTMNSMWAGRPQWNVHHMSLGGHIGYSAKLTQNNQSNSGYFGSTLPYFDNWIHIALMGDPTMRMHYLLPPSNLVVANNNNVADLTWMASPDATVGYNIFRYVPSIGSYELVNSAIVTGTSYSDNTVPSGEDITYIVKAVELKTTASGSYFNQSLGVRDNAIFTVGMDEGSFSDLKVFPNPVLSTLNIEGQFESYSVFSLQGQAVLNGRYTKNIDFSSLSNGSYFIDITKLDGSNTRFKLIHK
ncbi:MAG: T9SS type A sorting domain-containing protein [Crocinitomicaceae bacterium]|nr:T9SS type A sorting domain-containing protein [Crocinitomicaceae bacterium]